MDGGREEAVVVVPVVSVVVEGTIVGDWVEGGAGSAGDVGVVMDEGEEGAAAKLRIIVCISLSLPALWWERDAWS